MYLFHLLKAIDCVKRFVRNCLYTAEKLDVVSIAFPSLGTGKLHYPRRDVAAAMFDAVEEYRREAINRRLRHIYFIVYGGDESVCKVCNLLAHLSQRLTR